MSTFMKTHFDTEGPFGLPMKDAQARTLEQRLKALPDDDAFTLRRCAFERGVSELQPGERADVSWITEETPDRLGDIVLASGMDDSHFQLNPIVTLNHAYDQPPVGRSLWRRKARDGTLRGVKAKTHYPPRPQGWTLSDWPPDLAFELVKAGLLRGKSIGFIPLKMHAPTAEEIQKNAGLANVRYIIEEWLLAEYACCYLPMQPNAVVETVSKSVPGAWVELLGMPTPPSVAFTSLDTVETMARRMLTPGIVEVRLAAACERAWRKARGQVE
ncbi:MAG: hypothetical protein HYX68_14585 [Planctomycetes bacterium]|nr:hypothetical protein [Planctomycetota bacterium]